MKILLLLMFLVPYAHASTDAMTTAIPIAELKALSNSVELTQEKRLLLYFWASWCPDCRDKLTGNSLRELQQQFPDTRLALVNTDRDEKKGLSFIEKEKISYPVFRDDKHAIIQSLKLFAVPGWAVLEKNDQGTWVALRSSTGSDLNDMKKALGGH